MIVAKLGIYSDLKDPSFRGTYVLPLTIVEIKNQKLTENFIFNIVQHESFATMSVVMYFQKNYFLVPAIDDVIQNLQSGGFIEYWHYEFLKKTCVISEARGLEKLNLEHLRGAFEILASGLLIAFVAHVSELIISRKIFRQIFRMLDLRTFK